jgi:hypothetical protein
MPATDAADLDRKAARAHIEKYALSPRHATIALALMDSLTVDTRCGREWLGLANNVVAALDREAQR